MVKADAAAVAFAANVLAAVCGSTKMAQEVFGEHLGVISALCDNYARTEDAAAVAGLVRAQHEVAAACTAREEQVKEVIRGKQELN